MMVRTSSARDESERDTESEPGPLAIERLEVLILARLSVAAAKRPSEAQVSRGLQPACTRRLTPSEWRPSVPMPRTSPRPRPVI
jgi:hypothetical protein